MNSNELDNWFKAVSTVWATDKSIEFTEIVVRQVLKFDTDGTLPLERSVDFMMSLPNFTERFTAYEEKIKQNLPKRRSDVQGVKVSQRFFDNLRGLGDIGRS